jgi:Ferric reductase like transmembrane component
LSLITGIPYQHFNFLHRWLGYVIFAQSVLRTVGWTVIEARLHQPQPKAGREWIAQRYMIWGVVAQIFVVFIFIFSLSPIIKLTGYEFFRKTQYVVAVLFIGVCWGHWSNLACFMIASLFI